MTLCFPNIYHHSNSYSLSTLPSINFLPAIRSNVRRLSWPRMGFTRERVVVIMGATGTGKSQLSIDLATRFFSSSEIINSDKMQVYKGLDITTNKIPFHDRHGVPHHLLGEIDSSDADFSSSDYRSIASSIISDITSRRKLPLLVGGSNSFIHALLADKFDPFNGWHSISSELRYNCCFIWVDVSSGVLSECLSKRVDDMLDSGMFEELSEFYDPYKDSVPRTGLRKAIGVPEFDRYFQRYPPHKKRRRQMIRMIGVDTNPDEDVVRREWYEEAVKAIKDNTCQLAKRQIGKILRLRSAGWDLKRVDATEALRAVVMSESGGKKLKGSDYWEKQVVEPSVKIVKRFLDG